MSRTLMLGMLLAVLAAAALRLPQLEARPMHNDEGLNAVKLRILWERGSFVYDPNEFHGPTLPYFSCAWMKFTAPRNFADLTEAQLRMVTVIFGIGLILLLPMVADGLGPRATGCAALLTAISPAMAFYSRYFIHEMLLVFFTFLTLAAGWRYTRTGKLGWALLAGGAVGLMQATKETFVLALAAMMGALVVNHFWERKFEQEGTEITKREKKTLAKHAFAGVMVWLVIVVVLFSSFFTNAAGVLDAVRTYLPWLHRAGGASPHIHPWNFYLERLAWFRVGKAPIWSEGLIIGLALIGLTAGSVRNGIAQGSASFVRFVSIYTVLLTIVYSAIGYKTPWCLLSFWQGMILLAGVGTMALMKWLRKRPLQIVAVILLLAGAAQLSCQAWRADVTYAADRRNPYVYAQTSPDVVNLAARVNGLAKVYKGEMVVKVMAPEDDYGPLPWYLRGLKNVGWYGGVPVDPYANVMVVSTQLHAALDEKKTHLMVGLNELRPGNWFETYVETNLWNAYVNRPRTPDESP